MAENNITPEAVPTPEVAPIAAPAPIEAAPAAPVVQAAPAPEGNWFQKMDWVEVGMGALFAVTLFSVIYYYRNKAIFDSTSSVSMAAQIESIQSELDDLKNGSTTAATGAGF